MINIGTIIANLKLVDTLTPALNKAQSSLQRLGPKLKKTGASMRAAGTSMTMGLTAPIVGGVAAVAVAFGGFEKSMNRVKALTGATGADFEKLSDQAKELGKTTAFSASEAADAMGFLAMAGFKTTEIIGAMPGVLELAASAQIDLASAADITSNIMTGYGQQTSDLARTNNILVQAMTSANVDLRMLGESMKFVGPVAKSAGVSFEEATAAIAMMGNAGIQGSMAGTALRGAITKLLTPTKKAATEMRALGLNALDAEGNLLPMSDIVQQLGDKSATTAQMMTIFGLRAGPAMAGLVSQGHEALRKMTGELENVGNVSQRIAAIQMEGLSGAFTRFKSAASGAMIEMGEKLAPTLEAFLDTGIKVANWISDTLVPAFTALSPTTQKWVIGLAAAAAAAGPVLVGLGVLVSAIGAVMGVLVPLATALGGVAAAFSVVGVMASPLLPIIAAVALAFAAFKFVQLAAKAQIFGKALDKLKHVFGALSDEEYEAAKAARRFNEDLGDVTPAAEDLRIALGVAGVEGTVQDLHTAMANLGGVAGGLAKDEMALLAQRAIQLRADGETLTPELARIADQFERVQVAAGDASGALAVTADTTSDLADAVVSLRDDLSGANVVRDLDTLTAAWGALDDAQRGNVRTQQRAGAAALELQQEGVALSDALASLARATWLAAVPLPPVARGFTLVATTLQKAEAASLHLASTFIASPITQYTHDVMSLGRAIEDTASDTRAWLKESARGPSLLSGMSESVSGFIKGLTGGAGMGGFFQNLGKGVVDQFGSIISGGIASLVNVGVQLAVKGTIKLAKAFVGLFGRSTTDNLRISAKRMWGIALTDTAADAAADMATQVGDDFGGLVLSLGTVIDQAGGVMAVGFERVADAARDTFSAIDLGKIDAEQALTGLLPVLASMTAEFGNTDAAGQAAFFELIQLAEQFGLDMQSIVDVVGQDLVDQALGNDLPGVLSTLRESLAGVTSEGLGPLLTQLIDLGVITDAQRDGFLAMAGQVVFDTQAAEQAAERWGIALEDLGPSYRSAKIGETALEIAADFDMLLASGMSVERIIAAQGGAIASVVRDSQAAGDAIPEAMRPAVEAWIASGDAIDENGVMLTDLSEIDFAKPIEDRLADVMGSLGDLIQKFIDVIKPIDNVTEKINAIPDANVQVNFHIPPIPTFDFGEMPGGSVPGFAHGTQGKFLDFGAGTPAILHGRERITPISEAGVQRGGTTDMHLVENRLSSIEDLLRDQPRAFGLAIQDSLVLSR